MAHHLAQINVAAARTSLDDPTMAGFVDGLDLVNGLAERAPGFVWRLQDDSGSATGIQAFADPDLLVNLTVWESVDALKAFTYRSDHGAYFRRRLEWFAPDRRGMAMWWVPAGHIPSVEEAKERLAFLTANGPSPFAFSFASVAPPVDIERAELSDPAVGELIGELNAELEAMYPEPGSNFFRLDPHEVAPGRGVLVVVRLAGEPVACGAMRLLDEGAVEIKRMYVRPAGRGHKLGAAVLTRLEAEARALGATRAVLETGPLQAAAITVYERAGYTVVPCWGEYADAPASLCMEKALA